MTKINISESLPKCKLLDALANKACLRKDIDFNFFGKLDEFRQLVCNEIRHINELFPEYTPHDEQYHVKRLFHVADTVLGDNRIDSLNSTELFVLSISLYGHDWGMAVSNIEKQYITTGKLPKEARLEELRVSPNERERFVTFAHTNRLNIDHSGCVSNIPIELWRDYVRQTHAIRSGERVRLFFQSIDGGIADAASRVCEGHWIDFEELQNYTYFPPDFSVLRETINLRALAVYIRLIDLLDVAEDRTPYVIWKYVAPRDSFSKMEWAKHRALRPITCSKYLEGRNIRVDGNTDDHEVYAALQDLRIWCEKQFRGCNDVLARMNDSRHTLDIYSIEWRVVPRGFKPISIQFEFNRERMFEILSDEIYQGDPYIFLRELLQNSIDAIRMRKEILKRKKIDPISIGVIRVTVEHKKDGDAVITWQDDGIGMDEYIVRNYLAIAGNSFYRSPDFERHGLKMDPISRFGIGILSCFMVANHVEIYTFKEPYFPPQADPLKIIIPSIEKQFRIEALNPINAEVGTTFKIYVSGKKVFKRKKDDVAVPLDVTGYLSIIAGFVEFPIVINELDKNTVIIHPKQDMGAIKERFGSEYNVIQLSLNYPWESVFYSQDVTKARDILTEKCYSITNDLKLEEYDGIISYVTPKHDDVDIINAGRSWPPRDVIVKNNKTEQRIRWITEHEWHINSNKCKNIAPSSKRNFYYSVYLDGILLTSVNTPYSILNGLDDEKKSTYYDFHVNASLPWPCIIVNISKNDALRVDLARKQILGEEEGWEIPLVEALKQYFLQTIIKSILSKDSLRRLYEIGWYIVFYRISIDIFWEMIKKNNWPLLFLDNCANLKVVEYHKINDEIYLTPKHLMGEAYSLLCNQFPLRKEYSGILQYWNGGNFLVNTPSKSRFSGSRSVIDVISDLGITAIKKFYSLSYIRFLNPPWNGHNPPLFQEVWCRNELREDIIDFEMLLERIISEPAKLNQFNNNTFFVELRKIVSNVPIIADFSNPYDSYFSYGIDALNLKNSLVQILVKCCAALLLSQIRKTIDEKQLGEFLDKLKSLPFFSYGDEKEFSLDKTLDSLSQVLKLALDYKFINDKYLPSKAHLLDGFVPGTIPVNGIILKEPELPEIGIDGLISFGELLTN